MQKYSYVYYILVFAIKLSFFIGFAMRFIRNSVFGVCLVVLADANKSLGLESKVIHLESSKHAGDSKFVSMESQKEQEATNPDDITVYFIRHAKSHWNAQGKLGQIAGTPTGSLEDAKLTATGRLQSLALRHWIDEGFDTDFFSIRLNEGEKPDIPLVYSDDTAKAEAGRIEGLILQNCEEGRQTGKSEERQYYNYCVDLMSSKDVSSLPTLSEKDRIMLNGSDDDDAVIAVSNLSRAILTSVIALKSRVSKAKARNSVYVLSCLQELGEGIDAKTSVPAGQLPPYQDLSGKGASSGSAKSLANDPTIFSPPDDVFNLEGNLGNQNGGLMESGAKIVSRAERYREFCVWAKDNYQEVDLIVTGHSSWLREFFIDKLPQDHPENRNKVEKMMTLHLPKIKLGNASVVKFLLRVDANGECIIVPGETHLVFGAFKLKE